MASSKIDDPKYPRYVVDTPCDAVGTAAGVHKTPARLCGFSRRPGGLPESKGLKITKMWPPVAREETRNRVTSRASLVVVTASSSSIELATRGYEIR